MLVTLRPIAGFGTPHIVTRSLPRWAKHISFLAFGFLGTSNNYTFAFYSHDDANNPSITNPNRDTISGATIGVPTKTLYDPINTDRCWRLNQHHHALSAYVENLQSGTAASILIRATITA